MSAASSVAVELYLQSSYEPDAEYFDGEVQQRAVGEDDHSAWQYAIAAWFHEHVDEWNIRIRPELQVQVSSAAYLVPDVSILDAAQPREKIATIPPLAVFEVCSPQDRTRKMLRKFRLYEQMGIPEIWSIDPADGIWQRFTNGRLVDKDLFSMPGRGIAFPLKEISKLVK